MASKVCSHDPSALRTEYPPRENVVRNKKPSPWLHPLVLRVAQHARPSPPQLQPKRLQRRRRERILRTEMCVSILSIFFFRPSIRAHDLSLLGHDCRSAAQEIPSNQKHRDDQANDGQADEIQAVRVPRSVFPLLQYSNRSPGPIRNDVSDNVGKDLNGYVHLHRSLCHTAFVRRIHLSALSAAGKRGSLSLLRFCSHALHESLLLSI